MRWAVGGGQWSVVSGRKVQLSLFPPQRGEGVRNSKNCRKNKSGAEAPR